MARADHIFVKRLSYTHHGIHCGDESVIRYTGEVGQKSGAAIRRSADAEFANGATIQVQEYGQCDPPDKVIRLFIYFPLFAGSGLFLFSRVLWNLYAR